MAVTSLQTQVNLQMQNYDQYVSAAVASEL